MGLALSSSRPFGSGSALSAGEFPARARGALGKFGGVGDWGLGFAVWGLVLRV